MDCLRADGVQRSPANLRPSITTLAARTPIVTYALIAINLAIFALCVAQAGLSEPGDAPLFIDGDLVRGIVGDGEYWRLLTAGFLHFSVMHVAVNMISLYIIGRDLERVLGPWRYIAVYLIALFGGSAAVMLFEDDNVRTAGASGAIYGLMGALLVFLIKAKASLTPVLAVIGFNVVLSISLPGVSLMAHLGGLLFGIAATAAVLYLPEMIPAEKRTAAAAARIGWVGLAALLVVALALGVGAGMFYDGPMILR